MIPGSSFSTFDNEVDGEGTQLRNLNCWC